MEKLVYRTAPSSWPLDSGFGNHRLIVRAEQGPYSRVNVLWRRRDLEPDKIGLRIVCLETGEEIDNVKILSADRERGAFIFEAPVSGRYAVYYMPFHIEGATFYFPKVCYWKPEDMQPSDQWAAAMPDVMPEAVVEAVESRTEFDSFYPMEVPMTQKEAMKFWGRLGDGAFGLVAQKRNDPIRMLTEFPAIWLERGELDRIEDVVYANEYYVFQIALCARQRCERCVEISFTDGSGASLDDVGVCLNQSGQDWLGRPLVMPIQAEAGQIVPLWCGLDVEQLPPGCTDMAVHLEADGVRKTVAVHLTILPDRLPRKGCDDLWRLSRLYWLNSGIGLKEEVVEPYTNVEVEGRSVACLGRSVTFGQNALPERIGTYFIGDGRIGTARHEVLAQPMTIRLGCDHPEWEVDGPHLAGPGVAVIKACGRGKDYRVQIQTQMEFDGHLDCRVDILPLQDFVGDIQLEIPYTHEAAAYMIGFGREGGRRPPSWRYHWHLDQANNLCWLGSCTAGLQVKLKHTEDVWEICSYADTGLPKLLVQ